MYPSTNVVVSKLSPSSYPLSLPPPCSLARTRARALSLQGEKWLGAALESAHVDSSAGVKIVCLSLLALDLKLHLDARGVYVGLLH